MQGERPMLSEKRSADTVRGMVKVAPGVSR